MQEQLLGMLRDQLVTIVSGTIFLFVGLAACCLAAVRRQSGVRLFLWLGIWSAMYGAELLIECPAVAAALPHWIQIGIPFLRTSFEYLLAPVVALAWLELSVGNLEAAVAVSLLMVVAAVVVLVIVRVYGMGGTETDLVKKYRN